MWSVRVLLLALLPALGAAITALPNEGATETLRGAALAQGRRPAEDARAAALQKKQDEDVADGEHAVSGEHAASGENASLAVEEEEQEGAGEEEGDNEGEDEDEDEEGDDDDDEASLLEDEEEEHDEDHGDDDAAALGEAEDEDEEGDDDDDDDESHAALVEDEEADEGDEEEDDGDGAVLAAVDDEDNDLDETQAIMNELIDKNTTLGDELIHLLDKNGDGKVSYEELVADTKAQGEIRADKVDQLLGKRFEQADENKDGFLDKGELVDLHLMERPGEEFLTLAATDEEKEEGDDEDGEEDEDRYDPKVLLEELDLDKDGRVSVQDVINSEIHEGVIHGDKIEEVVRRHFGELDGDGDGFLELSSLPLMRRALEADDRFSTVAAEGDDD